MCLCVRDNKTERDNKGKNLVGKSNKQGTRSLSFLWMKRVI